MRAAAGKQSQLSSLQEVHPGRKLFTLCDHFGELHWIKREQKIDDFFGIEDLLAQSYEDAMYAPLIPT